MNSQLKAIIFIVLSTGLAWASRKSLGNFRSHGFYRFFSWELILVMIFLNLDYWFYAPFSLHQIASWLLLIISLLLIIQGAQLLHSVGKPDKRRNDPTLFDIEKTTEMVTVGIYRYVRHPIYSSLLFLTWGLFFKHPSWTGIFLTVIASLLITVTAQREEAENLRFFGDAYQEYMKKTKMFIPFLF